MKIGMQSWGTEGDIRPFIALAAGLSGSGHHVTLSATGVRKFDYGGFGGKYGFQVIQPGDAHLSETEYRELGRRMVKAVIPPRRARLLIENLLNPCLNEMFSTAMEMCESCDLVIGHLFAYSLRAAAVKTGTPLVLLQTTPLIPSSHVSPPGWPNFLHTLGWKVFQLGLDMIWKPGMAKFHRSWGVEEPGCILKDVFACNRLNLVAVSPSLFPADGMEGYHFCGSLALPDEEHELPGEIEEFLNEGPPPVFVTFGSMLPGEWDHRELLSEVSQAIELAGVRGIFQTGTAGRVSDSLITVDRLSHASIFPECAAVVHHCGCGTSHSACAAGVPSVAVPYTADQPMWAQLLRNAGVAPRAVPRIRFTPSKLAAALRRVLNDEAFSLRAKEIGRSMAREEGAAAAVKLIEDEFGG